VPELASVNANFNCYSNSSLTAVDLSSYLPTNDTHQNFFNCALTAASVNHILARCVANPAYVSGFVRLGGGANAAPTGQGITDTAILIERGVVAFTN